MSSCLIPGDSGDIGNVFWGNSVLIASFLRSRLGLELCLVSKTLLIRHELTLPLEIFFSKRQGCFFLFTAPLTQVSGMRNVEYSSPKILFSHLFCPVIRVLYKGGKRYFSVFRELISATYVGVKKQQSSGMWANSCDLKLHIMLLHRLCCLDWIWYNKVMLLSARCGSGVLQTL